MTGAARSFAQLPLFDPPSSPPEITTPPVGQLTGLPTLASAAAATFEPRTVLGDFIAALEASTGKNVARLVLTNNRTVMASWRSVPQSPRSEAGLAVRVHHRFLEAPREIRAALAALASTSRVSRGHAMRQLRAWWATFETAAGRPRSLVTKTKGTTHDLQPIHQLVARTYFPAIEAAITWGRRASGKRRRGGSIRLGSWDARRRLIRIHPALDQTWVPAWVIETIVHHELAHAAAPPRRKHPGRRRTVHHAEFRALEQSHPRAAEAKVWIAKHLTRLLRSR